MAENLMTLPLFLLYFLCRLFFNGYWAPRPQLFMASVSVKNYKIRRMVQCLFLMPDKLQLKNSYPKCENIYCIQYKAA
jgi:hypothetical protein